MSMGRFFVPALVYTLGQFVCARPHIWEKSKHIIEGGLPHKEYYYYGLETIFFCNRANNVVFPEVSLQMSPSSCESMQLMAGRNLLRPKLVTFGSQHQVERCSVNFRSNRL